MASKQWENFDMKAGKKDRGIDKKGQAKTGGSSGVPGAPNMGTPSWVKAAASHAERLAKSNEFGGTHAPGASGIRGGNTRKESIHGGQATRVGKDSD